MRAFICAICRNNSCRSASKAFESCAAATSLCSSHNLIVAAWVIKGEPALRSRRVPHPAGVAGCLRGWFRRSILTVQPPRVVSSVSGRHAPRVPDFLHTPLPLKRSSRATTARPSPGPSHRRLVSDGLHSAFPPRLGPCVSPGRPAAVTAGRNIKAQRKKKFFTVSRHLSHSLPPCFPPPPDQPPLRVWIRGFPGLDCQRSSSLRPVNLFQAFGGCSDSPHQPLVAGLHAVRPGNSAGLACYFRPRGASLRSRSPASLIQDLWHTPYTVNIFYGFFYKKRQKNTRTVSGRAIYILSYVFSYRYFFLFFSFLHSHGGTGALSCQMPRRAALASASMTSHSRQILSLQYRGNTQA